MCRPDYSRIVLGLKAPDDDQMLFFKSVEESPLDTHPADYACRLCEFCPRQNYLPAGVRTYAQETFEDAALTIRQYQSFGEITICENCIADSILAAFGYQTLGGYDERCEIKFVVHTEEYVKESHIKARNT